MPIPIAQTLFQQIFGSSLPTASLTKPTETSDQEGEDVVRRGPAISFQDVLTRQFLGPAILPKTIDTPSGKVFAPDDPIPAKPNILATYPEKEKETKIISSPMPTGEPKGLMGLPIPETQDKLKGFEKPQDVDTSVLKNVPIDKSSLKTQDYLDEKIVDELLKLRGGKQKFEESMKPFVYMTCGFIIFSVIILISTLINIWVLLPSFRNFAAIDACFLYFLYVILN